MSYRCRCLEQLEKKKGIKLEFDIVFKATAPNGFRKKMTYKDNQVRCPFCCSLLSPNKRGRKT